MAGQNVSRQAKGATAGLKGAACAVGMEGFFMVWAKALGSLGEPFAERPAFIPTIASHNRTNGSAPAFPPHTSLAEAFGLWLAYQVVMEAHPLTNASTKAPLMHTNQRPLARILGLLIAALLFTVAAHAADFVLMVDTSGSMNGRISAKDQRIRITVVEQALRDYLPALPQPSKVHLLAFNSGIVSEKEVLLDGPDSLRQALSWVGDLKGLTKRDGQTHLWTSLRKALQVATDCSKQDPDQPVIVRVLTDGEDTEKVTSLEEVIREFPLVDGTRIRGNLVLLGDLEIRTRLALPEGAFETTKSTQWTDLFPPVILTIPSKPMAGEEVRFVENTKSVYSSYEWHVDGQPVGTEKVLTWRFTDTGLHRVTLKVKGLDGRAQSSVVAIAAAEKPAFSVELLAPASSLQPKETIQFVARASDKAVRYRWEINDQEVGLQPNFTWRPSQEGNYTIKLTAWDAEDREAYQIKQVSVAEEPLTLQVKGPREATSGQSVQFVAEITGPVETLEWDFDDGTTSTQKDPQHSFNLSGNTAAEFSVSVRATSPAGRSVRSSPHPVRVKALMAIAAPVADFRVIEPKLRVGDEFRLVNTSQGQIDGWQWEVSGEAAPTERNPALRPASPGEKTVTLTVKGPGGVHSISRKLVVAPRFAPVKLSVEASARYGKAPFRVTFANHSSGDIKAWHWDFGDGHTSDEFCPEHEYISPGDYTVKVTAIPADPDVAPVEQIFSFSVAKPWPFWAKTLLLLGIVALLAAIAAELFRRRRRARLRLPVFYWPHDSNICQRLDFTRADESQELSALQILLRRVGASSNLIAEARRGSALILPDGREEDAQSLASGTRFTVRLSTGVRKTVTLATHEKPKRPQSPEAEAAAPTQTEPDPAPVAVAVTEGADLDWGWDSNPRK